MKSLLTIQLAAERLGVSVRFMRRLIAERRVPYIKCGHFIRFDPDELEAWIDRSRVQARGLAAMPGRQIAQPRIPSGARAVSSSRRVRRTSTK